ncbi:hypothetical protein ES319_A03G216600v1 [Gossypium barbadense]|uniref:Uncharacterized protein n=1 Tax=Gossypium barbadense TaxID=3634 RepID=A0A5J5WKG2_GOSBA|nr:hypothetical protein ES319_A03G216600v1 [Gossypium barbadense]
MLILISMDLVRQNLVKSNLSVSYRLQLVLIRTQLVAFYPCFCLAVPQSNSSMEAKTIFSLTAHSISGNCETACRMTISKLFL